MINEKKKGNVKIIEDYFKDKPEWYALSETEAKELFNLLP